MMKNYITIILLTLALSASAQTIWDGEPITITKEDGADWTLEENQDRITDNVWLTRQDQWALYNLVEGEINSFTNCDDNGVNGSQPLGTEWALGSISDGIDNLTFGTFLSPSFGDCNLAQSIAGAVGVLHLLDEDIYIDITFLSWSVGQDGGEGGFSYTRSTDPALSINDSNTLTISMYPNPATNQITFPTLEKDMSFEILNVVGQIVSNGTAKRNEPISINNLTKGVYFIRLDQEITKKFIKQ